MENNLLLENLYNELEKKNELGFIFDLIPKSEDLSEDEAFVFEIEVNVQCVLNKKHIKDIFGERQDKVVNYLNSRLLSASNPLLIARYNHFLWMLVSNKQYCERAIDYYQIALKLISQTEIQEKINAIEDIFHLILELSLKIKYKLSELKVQILELIHSSFVPKRLKTLIIQQVSKTNLLKNKDILALPQICIDIANSETSYNWIKINLDLSLFFLNKLPELNHLKREAFEMLGDNELSRIKNYDGKPENIVIPHQNQAIYKTSMQYFKQAKNEEKLDDITKRYSENKKNLKFLNITNTVKRSKESVEMLNSHLQDIINGNELLIMFDLCFGYRLPFVPNDLLEKETKEAIEKYFHLKWLTPVQTDINSNQRKEDVFEHQKFQNYHTFINNHMPFFFDVIQGAIINKKLSFPKLSKFLKKFTFFGQELEIDRGNEIILAFNWFDQIDFALKSFFQQFSRYISEKETDWRIAIDILTLKFEGILRDILVLSGGITTEIDRNGNTGEITLEKMINNPMFTKIFNDDDKNLFLYTFTKIGLNIRNNVAHSFFKRQDYTIGIAILVFLCVLRLTKFNLLENKSSNIK